MLQSKCDHQTRHTNLKLVNGYVFVCYVAVFWGLSKLVKKNWTGDGHWAGLNLEELTTFEYQIITKIVKSNVKSASKGILIPPAIGNTEFPPTTAVPALECWDLSVDLPSQKNGLCSQCNVAQHHDNR